LCGIVRNIAANAVRRELRRGGEPESLDAVAGELSVQDDPATQAITREEETLLWWTLAQMPESYREPLVLFYREDRSVAEVAIKLDLTEDTVRQRLSRGRAMLRDEVTAFVESTLVRSKPSAAFTAGVLAALPMVSATTGGAAISAGSAGAAGKGALAKVSLGILFGPIIGLIVSWFGAKAAASTARSKAERDHILRYSWGITGFCFLMSIVLVAVLSQAGRLYTASVASIVLIVSVWTALLVGIVIIACQRLDRGVKRIRAEMNAADEACRNSQSLP
jgi:hypothetical protein